MPVPLTTRQLDIHLPEPHPRVVVDGPFPKRPPLPRFVTVCVRHALEGNPFGGPRRTARDDYISR